MVNRTGVNRHDIKLLDTTVDAVVANGLLIDIETAPPRSWLRLPRPCAATRRTRAHRHIKIQRRKRPWPIGTRPQPMRLGLRWIVEPSYSWWSNYGQLRRNTDPRKTCHRHAASCLATTILTVGKLITYRDRWSAN